MTKNYDFKDEKPLVLIVDDVMDNIDFLQIMLPKRGYETAVASNGKSALEFIKERKPDGILLDIMMPEISGLEVCRILKNREVTKDIPILLLTSKDSTEDINKGFEAGADDYIVKPFNLAELTARLKVHVSLKLARDKEKELINKLTKANG